MRNLHSYRTLLCHVGGQTGYTETGETEITIETFCWLAGRTNFNRQPLGNVDFWLDARSSSLSVGCIVLLIKSSRNLAPKQRTRYERALVAFPCRNQHFDTADKKSHFLGILPFNRCPCSTTTVCLV